MISTGSIGMDVALRGGWRPGTMNEIWGDSGSGKTILALHTVESVTRAGHNTLWIDTVDGVAHMDSAPRVIVARPGTPSKRSGWPTWPAWRNPASAWSLSTAPSASCGSASWRRPDVRAPPAAGVQGRADPPQGERPGLRRHGAVRRPAARQGARAGARHGHLREGGVPRAPSIPTSCTRTAAGRSRPTVKDVAGKKVVHDAARFTVRPGKGIDQALELAPGSGEV